MRTVSTKLLNAASVVGATTSAAVDLTSMIFADLVASITDATPGVKTFASGVAEVDRITFAAKASTTNGDYFVVSDYLGGSWAVALDTLGTGAATPTGAAWLAVPSANKVYTDISSATTGSDVELLVATAINALTGFTAVVTTANSTTHLDCTAAWPGVVATPAVYSRAGGAGTGSVTFSITTAGTASAVAPTGNTVTVTAHGYPTGLKVVNTSSSSLPTGLSGSAEYVIAVDANTLKFATSLANAQAGTAIAITGPGVGTQTITPQAVAGTIKLQKSDDLFTALSPTWVDIASSSQAYPSLPGTLNWEFNSQSTSFGEIGFPQMRAVATTTSGYATVTLTISAKGA